MEAYKRIMFFQLILLLIFIIMSIDPLVAGLTEVETDFPIINFFFSQDGFLFMIFFIAIFFLIFLGLVYR